MQRTKRTKTTYRIALREIGVSPRGFIHGVTRANRSNVGLLAWRVSPTRARMRGGGG